MSRLRILLRRKVIGRESAFRLSPTRTLQLSPNFTTLRLLSHQQVKTGSAARGRPFAVSRWSECRCSRASMPGAFAGFSKTTLILRC